MEAKELIKKMVEALNKKRESHGLSEEETRALGALEELQDDEFGARILKGLLLVAASP